MILGGVDFGLTWEEQRVVKIIEYWLSRMGPTFADIPDLDKRLIATFRQDCIRLVGEKRYKELCIFAQGSVEGKLKKLYELPRDRGAL